MQSDENKRLIGEGVREFIIQFPPGTPALILPHRLFLDSNRRGLWHGVTETIGYYPTHHYRYGYDQPSVIIPLTPEVQRGVKASLGKAIRDDWMALEDLRALKIIEPLEFSLFGQEDPAAD